MAKPDRNPELMKEICGTTSLITDYVPDKKDTLTLDDVIKEMKVVSAPSYETISDYLVEKTQGLADAADTDEEKQEIWNNYLISFGFECGKKILAEKVLQLLEKLQ